MQRLIHLHPAGGDGPVRELEDVVRGLLHAGRSLTITVAEDDTALSPQEVAARLRFSRQHVRRLIDAGELEASQMPNSRYWKVPLRSVAAFEERRLAARQQADDHARSLNRLRAPPE